MIKKCHLIFLCIGFFATTLLAEYVLDVGWQGSTKKEIYISYDKDPELIKGCIDTGFQFEKRFLMKACENKDSWFRDCNRTRRQVHGISLDPIRKSYTVNQDLHGDEDLPTSASFNNFIEAYDYFKKAQDIPVQHITKGDESKLTLLVRVVSSCEGEYSEALHQLSYFFTLGFVDLGSNDSGWYPFNLE